LKSDISSKKELTPLIPPLSTSQSISLSTLPPQTITETAQTVSVSKSSNSSKLPATSEVLVRIDNTIELVDLNNTVNQTDNSSFEKEAIKRFSKNSQSQEFPLLSPSTSSSTEKKLLEKVIKLDMSSVNNSQNLKSKEKEIIEDLSDSDNEILPSETGKSFSNKKVDQKGLFPKEIECKNKDILESDDFKIKLDLFDGEDDDEDVKPKNIKEKNKLYNDSDDDDDDDDDDIDSNNNSGRKKFSFTSSIKPKSESLFSSSTLIKNKTGFNGNLSDVNANANNGSNIFSDSEVCYY
jgi:hypothetical protein